MEYTRQKRYDDFDWFVDNYDDLFKKYGKTYLAIRDKNVIGTYSSVTDALKEHSAGTCSIQECDGTPNAYTVTVYGAAV